MSTPRDVCCKLESREGGGGVLCVRKLLPVFSAFGFAIREPDQARPIGLARSTPIVACQMVVRFAMKRKHIDDSYTANKVSANRRKRMKTSSTDSSSSSDDSDDGESLSDTDSYGGTDFESAKNSTSVFRNRKETEIYLDRMISGRASSDGDLPTESPLHHREIFYSHLLPVYLKTHLLRIDMISVPAAYLSSVIADQGVKEHFSFENLRLFHNDNACLLFDHRFLPGAERHFVMTVVAHPVSQKSATRLLSSDDLTSGAGEYSRSSRSTVRCFVLRPNFSLTRSVSTKNRALVKHSFRESIPASFWWNTFVPPANGEESFLSKMQSALNRRPVVMDFLFLLANVDEKNNSITRIVSTAEWEPGKDKDEVNRAALTINTMLYFGFRILSFGMLCEYPKDLTKRWLRAGQVRTSDNYSKRTFASRRRKLMETFQHVNTAMSGVKRKAVMRMVYTLDTTESAIRFFKIMDKHGAVIKHRTVRSRSFYSTRIDEDLIGSCHVYPNHSLYMVIGSCNMTFGARDCNEYTASYMKGSTLDVSEDRPVKDPLLDFGSDDDDDVDERPFTTPIDRSQSGKTQTSKQHSKRTVTSLSPTVSQVRTASSSTGAGVTKTSKQASSKQAVSKKVVSLSPTVSRVRPSDRDAAKTPAVSAATRAKTTAAPVKKIKPVTTASSSTGAGVAKKNKQSSSKHAVSKEVVSLSPTVSDVRPSDRVAAKTTAAPVKRPFVASSSAVSGAKPSAAPIKKIKPASSKKHAKKAVSLSPASADARPNEMVVTESAQT